MTSVIFQHSASRTEREKIQAILSFSAQPHFWFLGWPRKLPIMLFVVSGRHVHAFLCERHSSFIVLCMSWRRASVADKKGKQSKRKGRFKFIIL